MNIHLVENTEGESRIDDVCRICTQSPTCCERVRWMKCV